MNRKQLLILLGLVVVLGGIGLLISQRNRAAFQGSGRDEGKKLFDKFAYNDVAHISIRQGTNEVNLVKKDVWQVRERYNYPANYSDIRDFLLKLGDLKVSDRAQIGPSQLARLELVPAPGATPPVVVSFMDQGDKSITSLKLGKKQMKKSASPSPMGDMGDEGFPNGRWVQAGAQSNQVALIGETFDNIAPNPEQWLNKDFFKAENIKSLSVTYLAVTNSFTMTRDSEAATEWKLVDAKPGEQLDSQKASGFSHALSSPTFSDVLPGDFSPMQTGLDKPTVVALETFDDFSYMLKVGAKTNDNYAMTVTVTTLPLPKERTPGKDEKPEDKARLDKEFAENQKKIQDRLAQEKSFEKWIYLVPSMTLDSVLKERGQLLAEKKEEPKPEGDSSTNSVSPLKLDAPSAAAGATNTQSN
jgi:hypothetical protein